jgi:FkbM family methyltransferase
MSIRSKITRWARGRRAQPLWERLYAVALLGMNVGAPWTMEESGEAAALSGLRHLLPPRPLVIDVGANRGDYAATVLDLFPAARVICFEPAISALEGLRARFGADQRVEIVPRGLDRAAGSRPLYADAEGSGLASVYSRRLDHHGIRFSEVGSVPVTTLDEYCASHAIDEIDLLKLDVEGHELAVLEGATETIARGIRAIQFEFGGTDIDSRTFIQDFWYLLSPTYRIHRIVQDGLREIPAYHEGLEIFGFTNYLCIRRA